MTDTPNIPKSKLKIDMQDIAAVGAMVVLSLAANFADYFPFALDKKYVIGALAAVLVVGLVKYLKFALVLVVVVLIIGANLPILLKPGFVYAPWVMTLTLVVLVVLASLNKIRSVPKWLDPESDSEPLTEKLHGAQALFNAITNGRPRSVRSLLRQGVDPNVRAKNGETPLMYAASRNEDYMVQMLLDAGADPTITNEEGLTPLKVAEIKHLKLVSALLRHEENKTK